MQGEQLVAPIVTGRYDNFAATFERDATPDQWIQELSRAVARCWPSRSLREARPTAPGVSSRAQPVHAATSEMITPAQRQRTGRHRTQPPGGCAASQLGCRRRATPPPERPPRERTTKKRPNTEQAHHQEAANTEQATRHWRSVLPTTSQLAPPIRTTPAGVPTSAGIPLPVRPLGGLEAFDRGAQDAGADLAAVLSGQAAIDHRRDP